MGLERWDFLTALIFTLATITTIGYGNVYPHTRAGEVFTASLMIVALAAVGLIVALGSDADNVFVSLSAHDLNPRLRIVARAHAASSVPKLRRSGANEVIVPDEILALNLAGSFRDRDQIGQAVQQVTRELRGALGRAIEPDATGSPPPQQILFRAVRLALEELGPGMDDML